LKTNRHLTSALSGAREPVSYVTTRAARAPADPSRYVLNLSSKAIEYEIRRQGQHRSAATCSSACETFGDTLSYTTQML